MSTNYIGLNRLCRNHEIFVQCKYFVFRVIKQPCIGQSCKQIISLIKAFKVSVVVGKFFVPQIVYVREHSGRMLRILCSHNVCSCHGLKSKLYSTEVATNHFTGEAD